MEELQLGFYILSKLVAVNGTRIDKKKIFVGQTGQYTDALKSASEDFYNLLNVNNPGQLEDYKSEARRIEKMAKNRLGQKHWIFVFNRLLGLKCVNVNFSDDFSYR